MASNKPKILFFIRGSSPTPEEQAQAEKLGTRRFRNASIPIEGGFVEVCDGVAGLVPAEYKVFPRVDIPEVPVAPAVLEPAPETKPPPVANPWAK